MKFRKFTFLYVPEDEAVTRQWRVPRWMPSIVGLGLLLLAVLAGGYLAGLPRGASWLPGGAPLERENAALASKVRILEERADLLRDQLDESFTLEAALAEALGLAPLDPDVRRAGVGGRGPATPVALGRDPLQDLAVDLDTLLRQARIQRQSFSALVDTLNARQDVRDHIPSIRPVDVGWLSSGFGKRKDPFTGKLNFHRGLDYSVPQGTPVRATADGVVVSVKQERGLGKVVKIDHGGRLTTAYAHLSRWLVKKGDRVRRGDVIAESGSTGRSTAPHLHYEVSVGGRYRDPSAYVLDSYAVR